MVTTKKSDEKNNKSKRLSKIAFRMGNWDESFRKLERVIMKCVYDTIKICAAHGKRKNN